MYEWLFAGLIVFVASVLQSAVGFGFAIVGTPLLLLVYDSREVVQINNFLSLLVAIILLPKIIKEVDYQLLKRFFIGSLFGVPLGLLFFAYVSLGLLKITVGILVSFISIFLIVKWYKTRNLSEEELQDTAKPSSKFQELFSGLLSGVLTNGAGLPGIPLAIYFNVKNIEKGVTRSTTLSFFIGVYVITIISQALTVKIAGTVITTSLMLVPALLIGVFVGNILHYRINQRVFQLIINLVLIFTGLYMIAKTI
ncbi:sulfite exporter TauE/SafE family protein [Peptococcaceae bacterium 1198_IL3148]